MIRDAAPLAPSQAATRFAPLLRTAVPDRASEFMASLYRPHVLRVGQSAGFDMALSGFELGGLHVGSIRYGSATTAHLAPAPGSWVFSWLRAGQVHYGRSGQRFAVGDAATLAPEDAPELRMSADMELVNLRVGQDHLADASCALLGIELGARLRFTGRVPAGSPGALALQRLTQVLATTPSYPHAAAAHFTRSLREAVLFELLLAWPGTHSSDLLLPAAMPDSIRRAREFIHAQLHELPSVGDVARAAGIGVRALCKGFERHLGTLPSHYITNLRLDRVRAQLLKPSGIQSVTAVAQVWGFAHAGAFAARYRRRFGERPSETLKQHGRPTHHPD